MQEGEIKYLINAPMRCPLLKGYAIETCRHHPMEPFGRPHPMTAREWESFREAACFWKEKYDRLYENQRRLQKINESLEEKLLHAAEKFENEKSDLTRDVSDLTSRLVEARLTIAELEEENEQYRNDCNIAVRLLQCKPSSFVAHKFNSLPADFQAKVKRHLTRPQRDIRASSSSLLDQCPPDVRTIKVSVPTLPPAAMVYSVNKSTSSSTNNTQQSSTVPSVEETTPDHVSAAIIAKVLEERSLERKTISSLKKQRTTEEPDLRNVAIQTDYQKPPTCRCQHSSKQRSITAECDNLRSPKDMCMLNSTETAI
ncbi:tight junction-associated protein 1-like isoform X2 [Stegodyphus dumicola]|uniref:tight junction-associated protein 1-like isoform X2 n=1 Tax=Stegodyphus dumicola TaxID=202533 RepID=UPI0015AA89E9|nr:tight junction-associated protein 1-like isoform X2 [Stegodyphus dumicola]